MSLRFQYVVIGLLAFLVFSINSNGLLVYSLDEAKNAECAREMYERNDWVVPTWNYELRTDKPPLHYYFMRIGFSIFGVNAWGARFFGSLAGALLVVFVFYCSRKFLKPHAALYSVLVLLASIHLAVQMHMAVPDPYLIFFMCAGLLCFLLAINAPEQPLKSRWAYAMYFCLALGTLSKGPVALALPGLIILLFLIVTRQLSIKTLAQLRIISGGLLFLAVALPWYFAVHAATDGAWTEAFFFKHNFGRYSAPMEGHGGPFVVTWAFVIIGLLPFTAFLLQALGRAWKDRKENQLVLFCGLAVLCIVGFFSVSGTKLPNYTVPAYPFIAMLIGHYLAQAKPGGNWADKLGFGLVTLISVALPIAGYLALQKDKYISHLQHVALWFIPVALIALVAFILWLGKQNHKAIFTLAGGYILGSALFFAVIYPPIDQENPVNKTLSYIQGQNKVVHYKRMNAAFLFYYQKEIPGFNTVADLKAYLVENPGTRVISRTAYLKELKNIDGLKEVVRAKDLFEIPTTVILAYDEEL